MHVKRRETVSRMGEALTDEQARLVKENIGLVGVHLRRYVHNLSQPRRDREWEDLFQEGCLGLIDAARRHRPEQGIPFASFALPRIHNAVSRALSTKFATVYVPPQRPTRESDVDTGWKPEPHSEPAVAHRRESALRPRRGVLDDHNDVPRDSRQSPINPRSSARDGRAVRKSKSETRNRPSVRSLSEPEELDLVARRHDNPEGGSGDTISDLVRNKYECAVSVAANALANKTSTRGDRDKLVRILTEERFLVPHDDARRPLRQIARDTHSSYARVAQCDKRLSDEIRRALETDPEFCELKRRMRADPMGGEVLVDEGLEHDLVTASAAEFVRRFRRADVPTRAGALHSIMEVSRDDLETLLLRRFVRLPRSARARLLEEIQNSE